MFLRPSARASPKNSIVASFFLFCPSFFGAFGAFFPLWGDFDLVFSALFQRPRFFFVVFCAPQKQGFLRSTNELNEEGKDASHKTHGLFSFFVVFFFLCCVSKAIYSSRRPLFERGEEPHQTSNTLSLSFSHVVESNERAQSTKKKRPCLLCVVRFVAASHKKDIPHQSKVPDDTRRQRERTRRQQTTTTTTTTTNDALWRKERRHFWTTTTTTTTTTGQQK